MEWLNRSKTVAVFLLAMSMAACGGGGGDSGGNNGGGNTNNRPSANAGPDQSVDELSTVTLDGSASSDPDGDSLTYSWTQTSGTTVTLSDREAAMPTFDAPDVTAVNTPDTLVFELTVNDGTTNSTANSVTITVNDVGLGVNSPPTADAGPDQTVLELTLVTLDASGSSDPDGTILTYSWQQQSGPNVALSDSAAESPTFTSPDVTAGNPAILVFDVTVDDGTDNDTDTVEITVQETLSAVSVSGTLSYEFVNPTSDCRGLDFGSIEVRPIRQATVQLLNDTGGVLDSTVAGPDGSYSFSNVDPFIDVRIRIRAEMIQAGAPGWNVEVRDNFDTSGSPPPLESRPLYVVDFPLFNTGGSNITGQDHTATTGWGGSSYTGTRAAAPFAILDTIYDGMLLILSVDATASFAPLDAFWSVNNTIDSNQPRSFDTGILNASFYTGNPDGGASNPSLFLLGDASVDTEEFDDHIVVHEWGHYFEDNFSRSDSIGGPHRIGDTIDPRLAFGEGWATGLAAIALEEPLYCDTGIAGALSGFGLNTETENRGNQGFYNEMSVATLLYDLWDDTNDGAAGDTGSIGFQPIYDVMTNEQVQTDAFTTLFSFATELRANLTGADLAVLESLLAAENVTLTGLDIWGSTQSTFPPGARDVDPIYTDLPVNGTEITICTNNDFDDDTRGNHLSEHRYFRITTSSSSTYTVTAQADPIPPPTTDPAPTPPDVIRDRSDPDMFIWRNGGLVAFGNSGDDDVETFTTQSLPADVYVANLQEWRYSDESQSSDFPDQVCFDVTMSP